MMGWITNTDKFASLQIQTMAVDYELSTMESRKQFFYEGEKTDGRVALPGEREFSVRVNKVALFGIFGCFLLLLVGLAVNIYLVAQLYSGQSCPTMRYEPDSVRGTSLLTSKDSVRYRSNSTDQGQGRIPLENDVTYCLDVLRTHVLKKMEGGSGNDAQFDSHDTDAFLLKVSIVSEKMDDLKGSFDVFEKKLDKVILGINEERNEMPDLTANTTRESLGRLSDQMTSISDTMETVKQEHEGVSRKIDDIQTDIESLSTFAYSRVSEYLLEFNTSVRSNRENALSNIQTLLDASLKQFAEERAFSKQFKQSILNNTLKIDALATKLDELGSNLSHVDKTANESKLEVSEVNSFLRGHVRDVINATLAAVVNNGRMLQVSKHNLSHFSIKTTDILQGIYNKVQGLDTNYLFELSLNISDKVTASSFDLMNIDSRITELMTYANETTNLQRAVLEKTKSMNRSVGSIQAQSLMTSDIMMSYIQNSDEFGRTLLAQLNNTRSNITQRVTLVAEGIVGKLSEMEAQVTMDIEGVKNDIRNGSHLNRGGANAGASQEILNTLNKSCSAIGEVIEMVQGLASKMATNTSAHLVRLTSGIDEIKSAVDNIQTSVTIDSNKLVNTNLSTAVIKLLDETTTIHEAVMVSSNQTPTCRSDGCFLKTIPVGLSASSSVVQKDNVRLANAQLSRGSIRGRLEVYKSSTWGTVCDDSFSNTDATVVCRMFGYTSGIQKQSAFFGSGVDPIHMDDVSCSGSETSILSCSHTSRHNCGHSEDVGVICS